MPASNLPKGALGPHPPLDHFYTSQAERQGFVTGLFDEAATDYDWITNVMSLGSGGWYRRKALERAGLLPGMRLLDLATGTGAVARSAVGVLGAEGRAFALDPSIGMMVQATTAPALRPVLAVADHLPLAGDAVDFVSFGYGLRHVEDLRQTFREIARVLRQEGRVLILELTRPRSPWSRGLVRLYLDRLVPWLVRLRAGPGKAEMLMHYFWETIDSCVPAEQILEVMRAAGFREVRRTVSLGILSEYTGTKA